MHFEDFISRFHLDCDYGFVGKSPLRRLPGDFMVWENIADNLQALTATNQLRSTVDKVPVLEYSSLIEEEALCERLYLLSSFIGMCYVYGRLSIPQCLSVPWCASAERLGTVPIITYLSSVILNYKPIRQDASLGLDNAWTLINASGSIDESWFYLITLSVETRSATFIRLYLCMIDAIQILDYESLADYLQEFAIEIGVLRQLLGRMYEENSRSVFFDRVRRYLTGWKNNPNLPNGLNYGEEREGRMYAGGSAAQSPLIQSIDIVLGIRHSVPDHEGSDTGVGSAGAYLLEMRNYMKKNHRDALGWLEENLNLNEFLKEHQEHIPPALETSYTRCLQEMKEFRNKHLQMVVSYILVPGKKDDRDEETILGTGGSHPISFLKEVRSHMDPLFPNQ